MYGAMTSAFDLNSRLPSGTALEGTLTWALVQGVGDTSGVTLTESGVLSLQGGYAQSSRTVAVWVTDGAGRSLAGQIKLAYVSVSDPASSSLRVNVVAGQAAPRVIDLNASTLATNSALSGASGFLNWSFASGQGVPEWMSLTNSGSLTLAPGAGVPRLAYEFMLEATDSRTSGSGTALNKAYGMIRVETFDFAGGIYGKQSDATPEGLAFELAKILPTGSGLKAPLTWTTSQSALPGTANYTLSSSGTLLITQRWGNVTGDLTVLVTDVEGKSLKGAVSYGAVEPIVRNFYVSPGNSRPVLLDLNLNESAGGAPLPGSFGTRVWSFSPGQSLPEWLTMDPFGRVSAQPATGTAVLPAEYFVEVVGDASPSGAGPKSYVAIAVRPVRFTAYLEGDVSVSGRSVDLGPALNAALGSTVEGATWSFALQNPPSGVQLSEGGTLSASQPGVRTAVPVLARYGQDKAEGVVWVNAMNVQPGPTLGVAPGQAGGFSTDLNGLTGGTFWLPGFASNRLWSLVGAQTPGWLTLSSGGVFRAEPTGGTTIEAGTIIVEVIDSANYESPRAYFGIGINPVGFTATVLGNSNNMEISRDLNALLPASSGLVGGITWTRNNGLGGQSQITLTESGTLSASTGGSYGFQELVNVTATDSEGRSVTGLIVLKTVNVRAVGSLNLLAGGTHASTNLNTLLAASSISGSDPRPWRLIPGQALPPWLSLVAEGTSLTGQAPPGPPPLPRMIFFESYDPMDANSKSALAVNVSVVDFTGGLVGDRSGQGEISQTLSAFLPQTPVLSGTLSWAFVGEAPSALAISGGTLRIVGGPGNYSPIQQEVLVQVTDEEGTKLTGSVQVAALQVDFDPTMNVVPGRPSPVVLDLNVAVNASGSNNPSTRHWAFVKGQRIPEWLTLTTNGTLQAVAAADEPLIPREIFVEYTEPSTSPPYSPVTKYGNVFVNMTHFEASLVRGTRNSTDPPDAPATFTLDLNASLPTPSGLNAPLTWSVAEELQSLLGGATVSASGTLSVSSGSPSSGATQVEVTDPDGKVLLGWVSVSVVDSSFSARLGVQPGASEAASFDLNALLVPDISATLPGTADTRVWSFKEGQNLPPWLSLSSRGLLSAEAPAGALTAPIVYVVQFEDRSMGGPVVRRFGSVQLQPVVFTRPLLTEAATANQLSVNLNDFLPAGANLGESVSWRLLHLGNLMVTISPQGQLTVGSSPISGSASQEVLVEASGGGSTLVGAVSLKLLPLSGSAETHPLAGTPTPTFVDISTLAGINLSSSGASLRTWKPVSGQTLPAWLSVNTAGRLSAAPSASDLPVELYLELRDAGEVASPTGGLKFYRVRVSPAAFSQPIYVDLSLGAGAGTGGPQAERNLNSLVTGTAFAELSARRWSILPTSPSGSSDYSQKSITEAGTFSVSNLNTYLVGSDIPVQVDNGSGVKLTGKVALRSGYPPVISIPGALGSGSVQAVDLTPLIPATMRTPGATYSWSPISGAPAPVAGMSIDSAGLLTLPVPTAAMLGTNVFYADLLITPPELFGMPYVESFKIEWVVGNFAVTVAGESGIYGGQGQLISLDLNALMPSSAQYTSPLRWELPSGSMGTSGWNLTDAGILSFTGGGMMGSGSSLFVVQAKDAEQRAFVGVIEPRVVSPSFSGAMEVVGGGSATLNLNNLTYAPPGSVNWTLGRGVGVQMEGVSLSKAGFLSVRPPIGTPNGEHWFYPTRTVSFMGSPGGNSETGRVAVNVSGGSSTLIRGVTTVLGSKEIRVSSTAGLSPGVALSGPGLAAGSTVSTVDGPNQLTLNLSAEANLYGSSLVAAVVVVPPFVPPSNLTIEGASISPVLGSEGSTLDLNLLYGPPMSGVRTWSFMPGQSLPPWLSITAAGVLSATPSIQAGAEPVDVYVQVTDPSQAKYFGKVTVKPVSFGTAVFADMAEAQGPVPPVEPLTLVSLDLNPLVSGTAFANVPARRWTLVEGQSYSTISGMSLSTGGTFRVSSNVMYSNVPAAVLVEVSNEEGVKQLGVVNVRSGYATSVSLKSVVGSGAARTENLNNRLYLADPNATVTWSLSAGAPPPTGGLSIDAAGTLRIPEPTAALLGRQTLYADAKISYPNGGMSQDIRTVKVSWAVVHFSAVLSGEATQPGGVALDLNGLLPAGNGFTAPFNWTLSPDQPATITQRWSVTGGGSLVLGPTAPGITSGQVLVQAVDSKGSTVMGAVDTFVLNPVFNGTVTVSAGQSQPSLLDLTGLVEPVPPGFSVNWSTLGTGTGVQLSGVSLLGDKGMNTGTLSVQPTSAVATGAYNYYVQRYLFGGTSGAAPQSVGRVRVVVSGGSSSLVSGVSMVEGSRAVRVESTAGLSAGIGVSGYGLAPGTTIFSVDGLTQLTLSTPAQVSIFGGAFVAGVSAPAEFVPPTNLVIGTASFSPVLGSAGSSLDLNWLYVPPMSGTKTWSFVPGQSLPPWLSITAAGVVSAAPGLQVGTAPVEVYVQVTDPSQLKYFGKVTVSPVEFGTGVFADMSEGQGAMPPTGPMTLVSLDLNPLVTASAFANVSARKWTLVEGQPYTTVGGMTLSAGGTFQVSNYANFSNLPAAVLVEVSNESGVKQRGVVNVRVEYPMQMSFTDVVGTVTARTLSLNSRVNIPTGSTVRWSLTPGLPSPTGGLSLDAGGTLSIPAPTAALAGRHVLYADAKVSDPSSGMSQPVQTVKATWTVLNFTASFNAEVTQPGGVWLDLNGLLPADGGFTTPLSWTLSPNQQQGTQGWSVTSGGSLLFGAGSANITSGSTYRQILVQATDAQKKALFGMVSTFVVNPTFFGTLAASVGQKEPSLLDLNTLTGAVPPGATVNWNAIGTEPGVQLSGVSLLMNNWMNTGTLTVLPGATTASGTYNYYVDRYVYGGTSGAGSQSVVRVQVIVSGGGSRVLRGATVLAGGSSVKVSSTAGISAGEIISGPGVQFGTTVLRVDSGTQLTLSRPATGSFVGVSLSVGGTMAPTIAANQTAVAEVGKPFSYRIIAYQSPSSFTANPLPGGLSLDSAQGIISGSPTTSGSYRIALSATNASGMGNGVLDLVVQAQPLVVAPVIGGTLKVQGQIGAPFEYRITATNAPNSYGAADLAPGLTLNTATGLIGGVPTTVGTFSARLSATNASGTGNAILEVSVRPAAPVLTVLPKVNGFVGKTFQYQIQATGTGLTYSATGLPSGLALDTQSGVISGAPASEGNFPVTVGAGNAGGNATASFSLSVGYAIPTFRSEMAVNLANGQTFSFQLVADGAPTKYTQSGLPAGLSLDERTGLISSGTQIMKIPSRAYPVLIGATNPAGTVSGTLTIFAGRAVPVISSDLAATATPNVPFSYQIKATNDPVLFSAQNLPEGLSVDKTTGIISGVPTDENIAGVMPVTIGASNEGDVGWGRAVLALTLRAPLPSITSSLNESAAAERPFDYVVVSTGNPTRFEASGLEALPGLSFDAKTGRISGSLRREQSRAEPYRVVLRAVNASGSAQATLFLKVDPAVVTLPEFATTVRATAGEAVSTINLNNSQGDGAAGGTGFVWSFAPAQTVPGWIQLVESGQLSVLAPLNESGGTRVLRVTGTSTSASAVTTRSGSLSVVITAAAPPERDLDVTRSGEVVVGGTVTLELANAPARTSFQWRKDGVRIPGATDSSLKVHIAGPDQLGGYDVALTNRVGTSFSKKVAIEAAGTPIKKISDLQPLTLVRGQSGFVWSDFSVANAKDSTPVSSLNYLWKRDGAVIAQATSGSFQFPSAAIGGSYQVTADSGFNSVSSTALVRVFDPVVLTRGLPQALTVNPGEAFELSVAARGGDPSVSGGSIRYQWSRNGVPIPGETRATLAVSGLPSRTEQRDFSVRAFVRDDGGREVSSASSVIRGIQVRQPLTEVAITSGGARVRSVSVRRGEAINLAISLSGNGGSAAGVTYEWRRNGVAIPGETSPTFTRSAAAEGEIGSYEVVATSLANAVTSASVALAVSLPAEIVTQPESKTVSRLSSVKFSVVAKGALPLAFAWSKDGVPLVDGSLVSGATTPELTLSSVELADAGEYTVRVSNNIGAPVTSSVAVLQVSNAVNFIRHPESLVRVLGRRAEFSVEASGNGLRYQWRRGSRNIVGATGPTLTLTSVTEADAGDYDVSVFSGSVVVASQIARLEVMVPARITVEPVGKTDLVPVPVQGGTQAASHTLVVAAVGSGDFAYQWFRNGVAVQGGTQASLSVVLRADEPNNALAEYHAEVTNSFQSGLSREILGTAVSRRVAVALLTPVSITAQPRSDSTDAGGSVTLSVTAAGGGAISYKWERLLAGRWGEIFGATSPTLMLSDLVPSDSAGYRVTASNARGGVQSERVQVTVREANVITLEPVNTEVNPNDTAEFRVEAAKGKNPTFQWYKDNAPIAGAEGSILRVASVDASKAGMYQAVVTHAYGKSVSKSARLTVREPASITGQPVAGPLPEGGRATLVVKAAGTPPLTYQWRKDGNLIAGANAESYTIAGGKIDGATSEDSGIYDVLVGNLAGSVASTAVSVNVLNKVVILTDLSSQSQSVDPGTGLRLSVSATGSPIVGTNSLSYQWRKDGVPLENSPDVRGVNTDVLLIAAADPGSATKEGSGGKYDVVVSNDVNSATSLPARITVNSPPIILTQPITQTVNQNDTVRFSVETVGTPTLVYQWSKNGVALSDGSLVSGATLSMLTLRQASTADEGAYRVEVTNNVLINGAPQPARSLEAQLSLIRDLVIPDEAAEGAASAAASPTVGVNTITAKLGSTVEIPFRIRIPSQTGVTIVYQWRKDGVPLENVAGVRSGVNNTTLVLNSVSAQDAGSYDLLISRVSAGLEKSRTLSRSNVLTLLQPPVIKGLTDLLARPGQRVTFAPQVVSSGSATTTYKWFRGTTQIPDATSPTLVLDWPVADSYSLEATDDNGTARATAVLSVADVLSVAPLPATLRVEARTRVSLEAKATGSAADGVIRYQWRFNGSAIRGAVRPKFELPAAMLAHSGKYDVVVSNNYERVVSGACTLQVNQPWRILTQPVAATTVNPGEPIRLAATLSRTDGVSYQWIQGVGRSSKALAGQNAPTLLIPAARSSDAGVYALVVTTPAGRITSSLARVNVNLPVTIVQHPASPPVLRPGDSLSLTVKATGTGPFAYQWFRNSVPVAGANSATFSLSAVSAADAGDYQAGVTNMVSKAPVVSNVATVSVISAPVITRQPMDLKLHQWSDKSETGSPLPKTRQESLRQGSSLDLSVGVTGDASPDAVLSYQWRRNGVPIDGETKPSLSRDFLSVYDTGSFDVVVTQTLGRVLAGSVVSRSALVVVHERPVFTLAPASETVALGGTATFRAVAAGTAPLNYAWRKAGSEAVLGTSNTLTLSGVGASSFGEYTLTVTGPEIFTGSVNSTKSVSATVKLGTLEGGAASAAFAVLPAAHVGLEKIPARLVARAADGYRIDRWERLATSGTSLNAQVISASSTGALTLDGGTLVLAAPSADADSGTYRAVAIAGDGTPVYSGWVSVYFNLDDPLYKPGFRADTAAVEALKNVQVVSAKEDGSATLRMYPIGEGLSFEWRKEGVTGPLANSNRTALTLRNLKKEDSGFYYGSVLIPTGTLSNGSPGVVRRETIAYQLIVQPLAVIEKDPESQALLPGQTAVFSIQTVVTPDTRFQWFFQRASTTEWVALPGATAGSGTQSTCQVRDIREVDEGFYRVEVTNGAGTVSSAAARLVVRDPVQVRMVTNPGAESSGQVAINPGASLTLRADIGTAVAAEELVGDEKNPPVYVFRRQKKNSRTYELLSSGTSSTYTIASVREEDDTLYTVSVEGKVNGQVTSPPVRVSVNDPVAFGVNPLRVLSLVKGESAAFGVVVARGYMPQFQWYRRPLPGTSSTPQEWQLLGGGTAATYAIASAGPGDSASYGVVLYNSVNDASGKPSSAPLQERVREIARVTVKGPPSARILGAPAGLVATQGGSLSVSAEVSDAAGGVVRFQWRKDGRLVSGGSGVAGSVLVLPSSPAVVTLVKPGVTPADAGQYELLVSNANGASLSEAPRLVSIAELPSIELLSRPQAAAASVNGTATFRVSAKANGPLSYQWQSLSNASSAEWSPVGNDSPVLSVKALGEDNGTRFRVVLSIPSVGFTLPERPEAELRVSAPSDVKIVQQPRLVSGAGGRQLAIGLATGRLEAVAEDVSGGTLLVYRWRKDGEVIPDTRAKTTGKATGTVARGADGKFLVSYDLPTVDNDSDGIYDLVVENGANFASSEALPLSVDPKILSLEGPALVSPGDDAKLEVRVAGNGAYTYRWYRNATEVGTSNSKLLISRATATDSGTYSVVVTSGANVSNRSAALPLVVARKVSIVEQPSLNGELKQGDPLTLRVRAEGDGSIAYQWLRDGEVIPSANADTFSVSGVTSENAGLYQVRVSNAAGSAMSNLVEVKVKQPLSVTLPVALQVDRGQSATLVPKVLPAPGVSVAYAFRWLRNGVEIPGATSEQYRISPVSAGDAGEYTVNVTNPQTNESVTSQSLNLTVRMLPQIVVPPASLTVGGEVRTASFAVVVSSTLSVSYQWTRTRNGVENSVGINSPYLTLNDLGDQGSSTIKVTVTDANGSASASARLTVGAVSPKRQNAGSIGVSQAYAYASYWIFWADALGTRRNSIYTTDSTRGGYWLIERKSTGTEADRVVTPGTSVWIWGDSASPALDPYVDSWRPEDQSVLDALDSESSDFSVLARGNNSNFAISGRVEPSGEAALYGAPAAMEGAYENDAFGRMEVNLAWDAGQVLYFDGNSDIESVKTQLKTVLAVELAKIKGE